MGNITIGAVFADDAVGKIERLKRENKIKMEFVTIFLVLQVELRGHHQRVGESSGRNVPKISYGSRGCGRSGKPRHGLQDPFDLDQFCVGLSAYRCVAAGYSQRPQ